MSETVKDLKALINLDIPQPMDNRGKHIVKVTLLLLVVMVITSFLVVIFAWVSSLQREDRTREELLCVRSSSVSLDRAQAEGLSTLIDGNNKILGEVESLIRENPPNFQVVIKEVDTLIANGNKAKVNLDKAVQERENSLLEC